MQRVEDPHYRECHEVSTVRRDLKKPSWPKEPRGGDGENGRPGSNSRRAIIMATRDGGSYKTITGTFSLPAIDFPANLEMDEAIVGVEFDDGITLSKKMIRGCGNSPAYSRRSFRHPRAFAIRMKMSVAIK